MIHWNYFYFQYWKNIPELWTDYFPLWMCCISSYKQNVFKETASSMQCSPVSSSPALGTSSNWASTTSLNNMFHCLIRLIVDNFFLISYLPFLPQFLLKSPFSPFLQVHIRYWKAAVRSLQSFILSAQSVCPHRRGAPALWAFLRPSSSTAQGG